MAFLGWVRRDGRASLTVDSFSLLVHASEGAERLFVAGVVRYRSGLFQSRWPQTLQSPERTLLCNYCPFTYHVPQTLYLSCLRPLAAPLTLVSLREAGGWEKGSKESVLGPIAVVGEA